MPHRNGNNNVNNENDPNVNGNNENVNEATKNSGPNNEYAGMAELFGDFRLDKDNFTQEELQSILEGANKIQQDMHDKTHQAYTEFLKQQHILEEQRRKENEAARLETLKKEAYNRYMQRPNAISALFNYERFIEQEKREAEEKKKAEAARLKQQQDEDSRKRTEAALKKFAGKIPGMGGTGIPRYSQKELQERKAHADKIEQQLAQDKILKAKRFEESKRFLLEQQQRILKEQKLILAELEQNNIPDDDSKDKVTEQKTEDVKLENPVNVDNNAPVNQINEEDVKQPENTEDVKDELKQEPPKEEPPKEEPPKEENKNVQPTKTSLLNRLFQDDEEDELAREDNKTEVIEEQQGEDDKEEVIEDPEALSRKQLGDKMRDLFELGDDDDMFVARTRKAEPIRKEEEKISRDDLHGLLGVDVNDDDPKLENADLPDNNIQQQPEIVQDAQVQQPNQVVPEEQVNLDNAENANPDNPEAVQQPQPQRRNVPKTARDFQLGLEYERYKLNSQPRKEATKEADRSLNKNDELPKHEFVIGKDMPSVDPNTQKRRLFEDDGDEGPDPFEGHVFHTSPNSNNPQQNAPVQPQQQPQPQEQQPPQNEKTTKTRTAREIQLGLEYERYKLNSQPKKEEPAANRKINNDLGLPKAEFAIGKDMPSVDPNTQKRRLFEDDDDEGPDPFEGHFQASKNPAKPQQNDPAQPQQNAPAQPQQNAPAQPQQNAPAQPQQNAPAQPQQNNPAQPKQNAPAQDKTDPKKKADPKKPDPKKADPKKPQQKNTAAVNAAVNEKMFRDALNSFNGMYNTKLDGEYIKNEIQDAWKYMTSPNEDFHSTGKRMLANLFDQILSESFEVEKKAAYEERRAPDYPDIVKSANDLVRNTMFAFTDLYHKNYDEKLFEETGFGGLDAKDMADLIDGESQWDMDQRSDAAWDIQSEPAKKIADAWLKEDKPYEKMIKEMNSLAEAKKNGTLNNKAIHDRLAAAEWLLINNDKMMIKNPEDPLNKMPNWGTRYWKAVVQAREDLGIPKHISTRELIQGDYAAMKNTAVNKSYNETQFTEQVLDPEQRKIYDSKEKQAEEFAIYRGKVAEVKPSNEKNIDDLMKNNKRVKISVPSEDEREKRKTEPKVNNFVADNSLSKEKNIGINK